MAPGGGEPSPSRCSQGDLSWPLERARRHHKSNVAVIERERCVTYEQLAERVASLGDSLDGLRIKPRGRIGFLGVNSLAHLECWLGIPASGRVLVDLNFRLAEAELAFMIDDCELEVLIAGAEQLGVARALRARCPTLRQLVFDGPQPCPDDCVPYEDLVATAARTVASAAQTISAALDVDEDTLATISYTGGTTGRPKGVMLSHGNLLANARHNLIATGHREGDRWLHVCPMFHVAGTSNVFASTWVGATQIVLPRFDPVTVAETIARQAITHTVLVPTMLAALIDALDGTDGDLPDFSSLRHVQYAASPISPTLQRSVLERFPCDIAQFYGMTEAAPTVTHCSPEDHRRGVGGEEPYATRLASMGAPVIGVQAEVRGDDGRPLAPKRPSDTRAPEVGEVWVRGPNVMLGYWNRPEATEAALVDGWYRSGDVAYADEDGYLYLVDRLKDMIITGGENVYSIEVEAALAGHPAVIEAAVFGIPHDRWGEAVHAVVMLAPGTHTDQAELTEHCRARIAGYKVPRTIETRTEPLPRSAAGKLLKNVLRAPYWARQDRNVS